MAHLKFILFLFIILIAGCQNQQETDAAGNQTIKDDLNKEVVLNQAPERVISLAPNLTEMIYALGVEKQLVGKTLFCYYPPEAKEVTKVGDLLTFDFEQILNLKPDLIFLTVEGNQKDTYEKLLDLGLKVFVSNPRDYEGIKKTFSDMGKIFNKEEKAQNIIAGWDSTYNSIKQQAQKLEPQSIMIMIAVNPLMLAGHSTFMQGYIDACNMTNFVRETNQNYPVYSREIILERNPDIIVYPSGGDEDINTILEVYPEWKNLPAVKENRVLFVDRDLYFRPGPRFVVALEDFYSRLTAN